MVDLRQTPRYALYMQKIGWKSEWENGCFYYIKKIPFIGSVLKFQRPRVIDHYDIEGIAKKHKVFQIVLEPSEDSQVVTFKTHKYNLSKSPYLPSKTIHINLTADEKTLLSRMHHKTRYNIKLAQKHGVIVDESRDIETFAKFWQQCAKNQRGMFLSQRREITEMYKAFGENAELLFATEKGKLIAGLLLIHSHEISYYMYAASTTDGKKLFAPTLLVWEALKRSKEKGSKVFDFEGVYDDRFPLPTWKGFSRFKKSFGGEEILYPGCFIKFRFPV